MVTLPSGVPGCGFSNLLLSGSVSCLKPAESGMCLKSPVSWQRLKQSSEAREKTEASPSLWWLGALRDQAFGEQAESPWIDRLGFQCHRNVPIPRCSLLLPSRAKTSASRPQIPLCKGADGGIHSTSGELPDFPVS